MNEVKGKCRGRKSRVLAAGIASAVALFAVAGPAGAAEKLDLVVKEPRGPLIKLVRAKKSIRFTTGNLHQGAFLKTAGKPLELWAHRPEPGAEAIVEKIDRSSGSPVATPIPGLEASMDRGLKSFVKYRITNAKGKVVAEASEPLCPNSGQGFYDSSWSRSSGVGRGNSGALPLLPGWWGQTFTCGEQQAESLVWVFGGSGPLFYGGSAPMTLPDGKYTYKAVVNPDGVLPEKSLENNKFSRSFTLRTDKSLWKRKSRGPRASGSSSSISSYSSSSSNRLLRRKPRPPRVAPPAASQIEGPNAGLPDPMALPASKFGFYRQGSRDRISFSSIVSNAGNAPIVLYGQRSSTGGRTMPGWQYTKDADGKLVRRETNGFVWDQRDTHFHWHYNKLAVYELLDLEGKVLRRSDKIGFCFMATTLLRFKPVGGSSPVAAPSWYDDRRRVVDCGRRRSRRVAMSLPAGWGDEYYQGIAGQSLDVTTLPAGSYKLRITVNPQGDLAESDPANNVSERLVELGGKGTSRSLTVPRQGIVSPEFHALQTDQNGGGGPMFFASAGPSGANAVNSKASAGELAAPIAPRLFCGLR